MTNEVEITATELVCSLSDVLSEVAAGVDYLVTRHGKVVARITSPKGESASQQSRAQTAEESRAYYGSPSSLAGPEGALAQLVSAPSVRRVLAIFLLDPGAEIHQREIARRAGAGLRSVQVGLRRLVSMGLLEQRRDGNRLYYRAARSERFDEVRALFAREFGIAEVIARRLGEIPAPVQWAFIFGSVAAGDDHIGSDIDLLVISEASDDDLVAPIADAQRELGRDIDLVSYRPEEFARKRAQGNHFINSVLAQPRFDVIGGDHDA